MAPAPVAPGAACEFLREVTGSRQTSQCLKPPPRRTTTTRCRAVQVRCGCACSGVRRVLTVVSSVNSEEEDEAETNNLVLSQFEKARCPRGPALSTLTRRRAGVAHQEQVEVPPQERHDDAERQGPGFQLRNLLLHLVMRPDIAAMRIPACFNSPLPPDLQSHLAPRRSSFGLCCPLLSDVSQ